MSTSLIGHAREILLKSKMSYKEENKSLPNAKIKETKPLVSLRFVCLRMFTCVNRQKFRKFWNESFEVKPGQFPRRTKTLQRLDS